MRKTPMSNKAETFEEWFKQQTDTAIEEIGELPDTHCNFVLKNMCQAAWNQQMTVIRKLQEQLTKAHEVIDFYASDTDQAFSFVQMSPDPNCPGAYISMENIGGNKAREYNSRFRGSEE